MTSIAIFGLSGALGEPIIKSLTSSLRADKIKYPIKAVSTKDKLSESTDKVQYVQGDLLKDPEALAEQLKGTDVIISVVTGNPKVFDGMKKLVEIVKPKVYFPSEFGTDYFEVPDGESQYFLNAAKKVHAVEIEELGVKVVRVFTAFFRIPPVYLYAATGWIGIDQETKTVTYTDNDLVQYTTGEDIGNSVAVLATTEPSKLQGFYRIYSGTKTVKEIVEELEQQQGVKYKVEHKSPTELDKVYKEDPKDLIKYLFSSFSLGPGNGMVHAGDEKELINPNQSIWKWGSW